MEAVEREALRHERWKRAKPLMRKLRMVEADYIISRFTIRQQQKGETDPFHPGWMDDVPDSPEGDMLRAAYWKQHPGEWPET